MNTHAQTYVDVRPIIDSGAGASLSLVGELSLDVLQLGKEEFIALAPAHFDLTVSNTGECVHVGGSLTLQARTICVRCLKEFELTLAGKVDELFYKEPTFDEHGEELSLIDDNGGINLEPLLRETLLLEAPFAPVHSPDCCGLCPRCGTDLNEGDCNCNAEPDPNHPLAGLKDFITS